MKQETPNLVLCPSKTYFTVQILERLYGYSSGDDKQSMLMQQCTKLCSTALR